MVKRQRSEELTIKVWGDLACFTRPEYATERVSYPCITPPAAVGFLSAIFWKPEFDWKIRRIGLINPPAWVSITRNEITDRASSRQTNGALQGISATEKRSQRHNLMLRDVAYLVTAQIELRPHADAPPRKYSEQFRRRVKKGAFFTPPYLGLREYIGFFSEPGDEDIVDKTINHPVGTMPLDLGFPTYEAGHHATNPGTINPTWFPATIHNGVLEIPETVTT